MVRGILYRFVGKRNKTAKSLPFLAYIIVSIISNMKIVLLLKQHKGGLLWNCTLAIVDLVVKLYFQVLKFSLCKECQQLKNIKVVQKNFSLKKQHKRISTNITRYMSCLSFFPHLSDSEKRENNAYMYENCNKIKY